LTKGEIELELSDSEAEGIGGQLQVAADVHELQITIP
jgi:hypothetical protein